MNDYSQHREGEVINRYFMDQIGTLISLGENDGKTLSNVLGLIESCWFAHLVEPSLIPFLKMDELHANNGKTKCYNFAIGTSNGTMDFFESGEHLGTGDTSLLSSLKESETKKWTKETFKKISVDVKTWETFIKEARIKQADLISIDCEGMDFDILIQIDFEALKTKMVIVEYNGTDEAKYVNHMTSKGFNLYYKNQCNLIFTK
jgi:FkbM family methyltransferase